MGNTSSRDNGQDDPSVDIVYQSYVDEIRSEFDKEERELDQIDDVRKEELRERFFAWTPNQAARSQPGPFEGERLTKLEVRWLEWQAYWRMNDLRDNQGPDNLPWDEFPLPLMGVDLLDIDLQGVRLPNAHLERAQLGRANLRGAELSGAQLNGANLREAHLENAQLDGADLTGAVLADTHLQDANLSGAALASVDLSRAHLEGANLESANLAGADLRYASLNIMTRLGGAILSGVRLDQAIIDSTDLSMVDWRLVRVLGDELEAKKGREVSNLYDEFDFDLFVAPGATSTQKRIVEYISKSRGTRATGYAAATRAYRMLSTTLQNQGLGRDGDEYALRAQVMQRKQLLYRRRWGAYLTSAFVALTCGYGYRLRRIIGIYVAVVIFCAVLYSFLGAFNLFGAHALRIDQALQISLNAIHGRVFFSGFPLDTSQSWLATAESVSGIVIEGVFVAALIQKLFSR